MANRKKCKSSRLYTRLKCFTGSAHMHSSSSSIRVIVPFANSMDFNSKPIKMVNRMSIIYATNGTIVKATVDQIEVIALQMQ